MISIEDFIVIEYQTTYFIETNKFANEHSGGENAGFAGGDC